MSILKRFILLLVVTFFCVGCDQVTKFVAKSALAGTNAYSCWGDTLRLDMVYNAGAFLSLGSSLPEPWRQGIFTFGTGILVLGTLVYLFLCKPGHFSEVLAVSLFFAGGVGNLIDRIAYGGLVVDFINLGIGTFRTGIFNVADVTITAGFLILFLRTLNRKAKNP
ncbi:MAG: signal peptidase II [Proteobacteria bacterium]|nr:signal peptidase II [Pseudomonadota bacterium]